MIALMRDLLKEVGKYFYDISKITFAVAVVTPFVKEGNVSVYMGIVVSGSFLLGTYIIYKGIK